MSGGQRRILVVGGGIAGAGAAAALAGRSLVTVVDTEPTLAYHTTGRSAALFFENYGAAAIRPLSRASRRFLEAPAEGLTDHPLLSPRGALTVGTGAERVMLDTVYTEGLAAGATVHRLDAVEIAARCPGLRPDVMTDGVWEPDAADIDVAALHQAFVRQIRREGGVIRTDTELAAAEHAPDGWRVEFRCRDGSPETWEGDVIVDAAGAWGDVVAQRCGVTPIGLQPLRRTAFMVAGSPASASWPLVAEVCNRFYFKPDGEQILCSLADETPSDPCDARPEEIDVASAIERINEATTLQIRHVRTAWAGLRTFAPDRAMVIGPDPDNGAFVWLVGQGGTGIQTAPAAGRLAAAMALGETMPDDLTRLGCDPIALGAGRFRS